MPWPDIFFKAKKRPEVADPAAGAAPVDVPKIVDPPAEAGATASSAPEGGTVSAAPVPKPSSQPLPPPRFPVTTPSDRATRTLPVVHGVILRPPARATGQLPAVTNPPEPIKNIEQLMAEADPVKTLSQTGNLRMLKHLSPEAPPVRDASTPAPIRAETPPEPAAADVPPPGVPSPAAAPPVILPPKATEIASPWPSFPSKFVAAPSDPNRPTDPLPPMPIRKAEPIHRPGEPIKVAIPATSLRSTQAKAVGRESTFLSRPIVTAPPPGPNRIPPPLPPMIQVGSIVKRKAKLADVARIVLPPKREETGPLPTAQTSPVSNPVPVLRSSPKPQPRVTLQQMLANTGQESPFLERSATKTAPLPSPVTVLPAQTTVLSSIGVKDQTVPMRDLQKPAATAPLPSPVLIKPVPTDEPAPLFAHDKTVPIPELQPSVDLEPIPPVIQAKAPAPTPPPIPTPAIATPPAPVEAKQPEIKPEPAPAPFVAPPPVPVPVPFEAPKPRATEPVPLPPLAPFVPKIDFAAPTLDSALVFDPKTMPVIPEPPPITSTPPPLPELAPLAPLAPIPAATVTATSPPAFEQVPQVDSEAHKTAPETSPKLDPEAHKVSPSDTPGEATASSTEIEPAAPGTREFHLTNGERVAGVVLSETPETIYLQHPSLGVLTVPRDEVATRLAEIILINGDRIVGNIMAETSDTLYVRHASLGMLSVPKAQRSARVVEAILKNGDRILGEVVTETDTFTVIKSATLGTVTVPHTKVSMLNRKVEQVEMKALPPALQAPPKG